MTEFSTEVSLLVSPNEQSLRDARAEIKSELGDISVDVSTSGASSRATGGNRLAGRERAMSRQLLTDQNTHLGTITDHLDRELELDETRNDLLRELIEETESGNFSQAKGGSGLGVLGAIGGVFAGILGGVGLGSVIASRVGDALGDINPTEAISEVELIPADVIASPASVAASDLVDEPASITVPDVIDSTLTLTAGDVIDAGASLVAANLIANPAGIVAADVIGDVARLVADDAIGDPATIGAPDVIADPVSFSPGDIVDVPEGGIDIVDIIAGGAAAGAGAEAARQASRSGGTAGTAARVGSAVTAPFAAPALIATQSERRRGRGEDGLLERFLPDLPNLGGGQDRTRQAAVGTTPTASSSDRISAANAARERYDRRGNGTDVEVNVTVERRSDRELERIVQRRADQLREDLRRDLTE